MTEVAIAREDLERLCSAATAFVALQRLARATRTPLPAGEVSVSHQPPIRLDPERLAAELDDLERVVVRTRRLLGWRRR